MTQQFGLEEATEIARKLFPGFSAPVEIGSSYQEDAQAWYLWQKARGGGAVLVSAEDGSFLFASSAVSTDQHLEEFAKGTRTDPGLLSS